MVSACASPSTCQEHLPRHNVKKMSALFELQVRLKKEVLDESIRGNAKQRAPMGANFLTGDQWYVQQASRSAHAALLCHVPARLWLTLLFDSLSHDALLAKPATVSKEWHACLRHLKLNRSGSLPRTHA